METKVSSIIGMLVIVLIILPTAWFCYTRWVQLVDATENPYSNIPTSQDSGSISQSEKEKIDAWIIKNNLNQYGDAKNTVYGGGSPLFDEKTGQKLSKYEYIISKYPDKPWESN